MNDNQAQHHDPCEETRANYSAYLDEALDSATREQVEKHLSHCADCLRELHGYKQVSDLYAAMPQPTAPPDFEQRVMAAIRPQPSLVAQVQRYWKTGAALAAALLCTVSLALFWSIGQDPRESHTAMVQNFDDAREAPEPAAPVAEADVPADAAEPEASAPMMLTTPMPLEDEAVSPGAVEEDAASPRFEAGAELLAEPPLGLRTRQNDVTDDSDVVSRSLSGAEGASPMRVAPEAAPPPPPPPEPAPEPEPEPEPVPVPEPVPEPAEAPTVKKVDAALGPMEGAQRELSHHRYIFTGGYWIESSDDAVPPVPPEAYEILERDAPALDAILKTAPERTMLLHWEAGVFFQHQDAWYLLLPAAEGTPSPDQAAAPDAEPTP